MNEETHNKEFQEAEVVGNKKTKKARAFNFAKTSAAGFAVNQAFERVDGVRKQMILVIILWTAGIVLGVTALVLLIGWVLFAILPNGLAGVLLGVIVAPVIWGVYFVIKSINALSTKTTIKRR